MLWLWHFQVYIVAMTGSESSTTPSNNKFTKMDNEIDNDQEFNEFESKGESLLTLVQPELVSLSCHWLAALKDHALLSLPSG